MTNNNMSRNILFLASVFKNISRDREDVLATNPDIEVGGKITKLLSRFVIHPNIIVSNKLKYMDDGDFKKVIRLHVDVFSAFFTTAVRVMAELYGLQPQATIQRLGDAGTKIGVSDLRELARNLESYSPINELLKDDELLPALEASEDYPPDAPRMAYKQAKVEKNTYDKDTNLYARLYEISLTYDTPSGSRVLTIPFIIKPNIIFTDMPTLLENLVENTDELTLSARIQALRAGAIGWRDLIFATDLVKKYRARKLRTENDVAKMIKQINDVTTVKDLMHGRVHFSRNYNMYIMTQDEKYICDKLVGGNVYQDKYKNKLTDELNAFSVSFVDVDHKRVTMLIDSISGFSVINFNHMSSDKDIDVNDLFKNLLTGRTPF